MTGARAGTARDALTREKRALRRRMLALRRAVSPELAREVGARIAARVVETEPFRSARTLALYAASDGEPDLQDLYSSGRAAGKRLLLPRCDDDGRLAFCVVERWQDLAPGRFGLLEPPRAAPRVESASIDLALVPCVAVDDRGVRLGRGGGWYDRSFAERRADAPVLLAAIHAFQRVDRVPEDESDRRVDGYASELGLFWTCGRAGVASAGRGGESRGR